MNQQEFEQKFNKRVSDAIKDMIFPAEEIPDGLRDYLTISLPCFTYHAVKCTLEQFENVANWAANGGELPMVTAFVSLQITRGVTAKDISVNLITYIEMNKLLDEMALAWDVMTKAIKEKANRDINEEWQLDQAKSKLNPGKRIVLPKS